MKNPKTPTSGGNRVRANRTPRAKLLERLSRAHGSPLLEAFPAEHRAPLRWPERYRGFLAALRTTGLGFGANRGRPASATDRLRTFSLTRLAALRFVFEAFVGEEHLFAGGKNEFGAALRALQNL